jgi:hypothetical protein
MILNSSKKISRRFHFEYLFRLFLDIHFNKGLIENCKLDINKYCQGEIVDQDDETKDADDDQTNNNGK